MRIKLENISHQTPEITFTTEFLLQFRVVFLFCVCPRASWAKMRRWLGNKYGNAHAKFIEAALGLVLLRLLCVQSMSYLNRLGWIIFDAMKTVCHKDFFLLPWACQLLYTTVFRTVRMCQEKGILKLQQPGYLNGNKQYCKLYQYQHNNF